MAKTIRVMIAMALVVFAGGLMGCGEGSTDPDVVDEAPIVAPTNVTATILANGEIVITWDANSQSNLKGYNVYRLDAGNGAVGRLNNSPLGTNSYVDQDVEPRTEYEYRVTSVSMKDVESSFSAVTIINLTVQGGKHRGFES